MPRRLLIGGFAMLANSVAFFVAFFVGLRVVYAVVFMVLGLGRVGPGVEPVVASQHALLGSILAVFLAVGALMRVWSRDVMAVVIPAAAMFLVGMLLIAQSMYLVDRGDPAVMWQYVRPRLAEYIGAACAAAAAAVGWYAASRISFGRRDPPGA